MTMKTRLLLLIAFLMLTLVGKGQTSVRQTIRLDEGWKFAFGHASGPQKDFGGGTEYFNYLTKANSIHNEGPYSPKFDDKDWQEVRVPHDWVTTLPYASEASHSHGYKTVGYKYPETSVGWYRKTIRIEELKDGNLP
jgi:beta-galactosidase